MLNRNEFACLIGSSYANLDNLTRAGQLALAFGLIMPAAMGAYHPLDVVANALADALVERGFPREIAVRVVREAHEVWLLAVTRAEWEMRMATFNARGEKIEPSSEIFFAIARERRGGKGEFFHFAAGLPDEAAGELRRAEGRARDMVLINVHEILDGVRAAFHENDLLEEFVVGPGANMPLFTRPRSHPEYVEWRAEIERYRQQSIDRVKMRERLRRERKRARATAT